VLQSDILLPGPGEATVRIWRDHDGVTRWGLDWNVCQASELKRWAPLLATRIMKLGWETWWLDVACLIKIMNLPADKALDVWGACFWDAYTADALVLLDVGQERRSVYQAVRRWENRFSSVRFSSGHDYDGQVSASGSQS